MPKVTLPTGMGMYYEVGGSGPPLLMIMGTASGHETWAGQVAAYRDDFTVITYDARGTGQSTHTKDPKAYTMASLADDAAALVRHLGIGPVHVGPLTRFGHGTGTRASPPGSREVAAVALHLGALG